MPADRVEFPMPTFGQWVKAGMGFTIGAGIVTVTFTLLYLVFVALPLILAILKR